MINHELGRTYFPNINFNNINNDEKLAITSDIKKDFDIAFQGLKELDSDSFLGVYVAYKYYRELLKKIEKLSIKEIQNKE